ncbi:MAG: family 43 glycosylhydrolase [Ginsengibacter sp.]
MKRKEPLQTTYINPLVNDDFPDPSVIELPGLGYYAYATHDEFSPTINNILVRHSWDLINWSEAEGALTEPPVWAKTCRRFWCPHVAKVNDKYYMYYAAEPDTKDGMCLAFATSNKPFAFADCGHPFRRSAGSTYQMIDPCFFIDPVTKKYLLYYGSAHEPIRVVELAADGVTIINGPVPVLYPGNEPFQKLREGAFVTYNKTSKRYFLYVSGDNTWAENSYAISVFWSFDPTKNFTKIPGQHIIVQPNSYWDSPGQNCIIKDSEENEWIIYHAVERKDRIIKGTNIVLRKMCLDRILYTSDGWPYVENNSPSFAAQPVPVVKPA